MCIAIIGSIVDMVKKFHTETVIPTLVSTSITCPYFSWYIFRRKSILHRDISTCLLGVLALIIQVFHPVHDQSFYLTLEHKRKLKEEYGQIIMWY